MQSSIDQETGTTHLTTADLADRWRCSTGHLANLRSGQKGLDYLRIGRRIAYRLSDVRAFEDRCLVSAGGHKAPLARVGASR